MISKHIPLFFKLEREKKCDMVVKQVLFLLIVRNTTHESKYKMVSRWHLYFSIPPFIYYFLVWFRILSTLLVVTIHKRRKAPKRGKPRNTSNSSEYVAPEGPFFERTMKRWSNKTVVSLLSKLLFLLRTFDYNKYCYRWESCSLPHSKQMQVSCHKWNWAGCCIECSFYRNLIMM